MDVEMKKLKLTDEMIEDYFNYIRKVDEVYYELRKGVPQTQYVIEVEEGDYWDGIGIVSIPKDHIGYYIQELADDNTYISLKERLVSSDWKCDFIKVNKVLVTKTDWEPIYE